MAYVVTFEDYTPPSRLDAVPWVEAIVSECVTRAGTYADIQTVTLDPVDTDPADPQSRSFTIDTATLATGWYRITWRDGDGNQQTTDPVLNAPYRPTVEDVGAILRARTRDPNGVELGTFTTVTRPTGRAVEALIDRATAQIVGTVNVTSAELLSVIETDDVLREAIALRAAVMIESSYFPEQLQNGTSPILTYNDFATAMVGSAGGTIDANRTHLI